MAGDFRVSRCIIALHLEFRSSGRNTLNLSIIFIGLLEYQMHTSKLTKGTRWRNPSHDRKSRDL